LAKLWIKKLILFREVVIISLLLDSRPVCSRKHSLVQSVQETGSIHIPQTIIFDLGRVLVQVDFRRGIFRHYTGDPQAADDLHVMETLFADQTFIDYATGRIQPYSFYQQIRDRYRLTLSFEDFVGEWCEVIVPMAGMAELVAELSGRYKLGLLSDTDPLHWQTCRQRFPFLHLFQHPTLSFETGWLKPDQRCYQRAAENAGSAVQSCLFIDDREVNVLGAHSAGMPAIQFKGVDLLRKELKYLQIL
jgi:HAD superfamily hydrolase (TIGR01509 family)